MAGFKIEGVITIVVIGKSGIIDGLGYIDLNPPQGINHFLKASKVDFGVKMNGNSQVVLNRLHRQSRTPARIIVPVPKEIGFVDAIFIVTGNRHPQVSGNR